MSEPTKHLAPENPLSALESWLRGLIRGEIQASTQTGYATKLLTPEELADCLKVPVSWVYEQSHQKKIPTHRIGRYIRFNLQEVLTSQKKV